MSALRIAAAGAGDLPEIQDLYRHLNPEDPRCPDAQAKASLERLQSLPGSAVLIGRLGGRCVASVTLVVIPNLSRGGAPYALIENVVTAAEHRRAGHGLAMLRKAAARAGVAGCYKVMLMTGSTRAATLEFYRKAGFEQSKTGFQMRRVSVRSD